jgi:hypothetical protein
MHDAPYTETRRRIPDADAVILAGEETLVADVRSCLTPSQQVERKLIDTLKGLPLMVSQVQRRLKPGRR